MNRIPTVDETPAVVYMTLQSSMRKIDTNGKIWGLLEASPVVKWSRGCVTVPSEFVAISIAYSKIF